MAEAPEGEDDVGTVRAIIPAGATEVLEIDRGPGLETLLVPFTNAAVPEINVKAGWLKIDPPPETEARETEEERPPETRKDEKRKDEKR